MKQGTIIGIVIVVIIVVVAAAALALFYKPSSPSSYSGPQSGSSSKSSVNIQNFTFDPTPLNVTVGTTVTWTNNDPTTHTVTSTSGPASFNSGNLAPGATYSFTFTQAGTYDYMCTIHTFMHGQVIVTSGSSNSTQPSSNQSNPSPAPSGY